MSIDRDAFQPAAPAPPPAALPPTLRALLRALALDLNRLAALLAQHAREEEARRAARTRRRPSARRKP